MFQREGSREGFGSRKESKGLKTAGGSYGSWRKFVRRKKSKRLRTRFGSFRGIFLEMRGGGGSKVGAAH